MRIIILGHTGSGKTTQAKFLARLLKSKHIETGALLRKKARKNKYIKKFMIQGNLVPNKIVIEAIHKALKDKRNFVLDGFPRTLTQARSLKFIPDKIIYLKTSKENIVKRLLRRKRFDDTKKAIETRYKVYLKQTLPVIDYYKKLNALNIVNGNPTEKEVSKNIKKILIKYQLLR